MKLSKTIMQSHMFHEAMACSEMTDNEKQEIVYTNPLNKEELAMVPLRESEEIWKMIFDHQAIVICILMHQIDTMEVIHNIMGEKYEKEHRMTIVEHILWRIVTDKDNTDLKGVIIELSKLSEVEIAEGLRALFIDKLTDSIKTICELCPIKKDKNV